jgi:Protein of unknown function (DUF2909)
MKGIVVVVLLFIVVSLGKALSSMTQGGGSEQSLRVANALTARIVLSAGLFLLLIVGSYFGWIEPRSLH